MDDGNYTGSHEITFSENRWYEKVLEYVKFLPYETPVFLAICISLWGFAEIAIAASGERLTLSSIAGPILIIGLVTSLARAFYRYWSYIPKPIELESPATKRIYKKHKCGWQFAMARQMLSERLAKTEASLDRIQRGAQFVEANTLDVNQYLKWLTSRPKSFLRLSHSISVLCTTDIPRALASPRDHESLALIVTEIDSLAELYEKLKEQEIACYAADVPDPLIDLHALTYGWTETIRSGVHQFLDILDKLATIDRKRLIAGTIQPPSFSFVFDSPPALEKFSKAINNFDYSSLRDYVG